MNSKRRLYVVGIFLLACFIFVGLGTASAKTIPLRPYHPPECVVFETKTAIVVECTDRGRDIVDAFILVVGPEDMIKYKAEWDGATASIYIMRPEPSISNAKPIMFTWCVLDKNGAETIGKHEWK